MQLKELQSNKEIWGKLIDNQCVIYVGSKIIFEGKLSEAQFTIYTDPKTVCKIFCENKDIVCLVNENEAVNKLHTFATIDNILETKVYNKAIGIASQLPIYNIINEKEIDIDDKVELRKHGSMYKIVLENLLIKA